VTQARPSQLIRGVRPTMRATSWRSKIPRGMMISRHWRGVAKPEQAEAYVHHLRHDTFPTLARIPGFIEASILRRDVETGTEFQIVTLWDSLGAIKAFAGEQPDIAVVPASVQAMMSRYDERVVHYDVAGTFVPEKPVRTLSGRG
jgi:heme-degrading monooxygenase HmoA